MTYHLTIDFADSVVGMSTSSDSAKEILEQLKKYDHEGSSVTLEVQFGPDDGIYSFLENQARMENE